MEKCLNCRFSIFLECTRYTTDGGVSAFLAPLLRRLTSDWGRLRLCMPLPGIARQFCIKRGRRGRPAVEVLCHRETGHQIPQLIANNGSFAAALLPAL